MSEIKVGDISVRVYNDGFNPATYYLRLDNPNMERSLEFRQEEAEILIAALKPLVKQNKVRKRQ